jgi:hypothetical protein
VGRESGFIAAFGARRRCVQTWRSHAPRSRVRHNGSTIAQTLGNISVAYVTNSHSSPNGRCRAGFSRRSAVGAGGPGGQNVARLRLRRRPGAGKNRCPGAPYVLAFLEKGLTFGGARMKLPPLDTLFCLSDAPAGSPAERFRVHRYSMKMHGYAGLFVAGTLPSTRSPDHPVDPAASPLGRVQPSPRREKLNRIWPAWGEG